MKMSAKWAWWIAVICSSLVMMLCINLMPKLFEESISLVRYEDLSLNPIQTARKLFDKLDLEFTMEVENWLSSHTSRDDVLANPHSTTRNSRDAPLVWFSRLRINEVIEIQEFCADVMQNLGYKQIIDIDYDDNDTKEMNTNYTLDQILEQSFPLQHLLP